ncbi:class I SAM-dependent methyltransferase [Solilutibacter silvestris]|uniref:Methyltransferase domain n=1 Tax=Solilutibacter silvestris TaxID=1645665 RepID=A0A2K1Q1P7_9GAMM|nr:class I SAM-dependent methyltransferase [Lysobacter silvestris]PNS08956.1 Methyltransferase domain [Lysobacter silvestris]
MNAAIDAGVIARAYLAPERPFDRWHANYARWKLARDPLYPGVLPLLRDDPQPLLDLGCGIGLLAHVLRGAGAAQAYRGVDFDAAKIARARDAAIRRQLQDVTFDTADLSLGVPAHRGSVTILDMLQYLPGPLQANVVSGAISCLVPGAQLLIRTGIEDASTRSRITDAVDRIGHRIGWMRSTPQRYPRREVLTAMLESAGLQVEWRPHLGGNLFNNWLVSARRPA